MSQAEPKTFPSKCRLCERPMSKPLVCDFCHGLNATGLTQDYFTLLGIPQQFDLDEGELNRRFFALSDHVHPDRHANESPEVQQLALAMAAAVNDAYRTLKDPALRGTYLLQVLGGKSSADDKSVPEGFLETAMMMQEELAEAKSEGNAPEIDRLRVALRNQHDGLIRRIGSLFRQYDESVACNAVRTDLLEEIRQQLNGISYVKKLLSQSE